MKKIIFVNGINTHIGGSGTIAINYWIKLLRDKYNSVEVHNIVPNFKNKIKYISLFFYYFPFCLLRIKNISFVEFIYKISIFSILRILIINKKNTTFIFSHHSIFYLMFLVKKKNRILLCQDLLLKKAKSLSNNRVDKIISSKIENFYFNRAYKILVHSIQEKRYLNTKGYKNVFLISCFDFDNRTEVKINLLNENLNNIAVSSDWRRYENISGLKKFIYSSEIKKQLNLSIYGFSSNNLTISHNCLNIKLKGEYDSYEEIKEYFLLVPIYKGAGIKLKVLEAINNNKIIIGTSAAFVGLPKNLIKYIGFKVKNFNDISHIDINNFSYDKKTFVNFYNLTYLKISDVI